MKPSSQRARAVAAHSGSAQRTVDRIFTLPAELGPVLVNLISEPDRDIRLNTAKLLSLMGELNSAEKLLEQHKAEQDDEVRTEEFVALGVACSYAFLPNSGIKIPVVIKKQTLELACEYLGQLIRERPRKVLK